MGAVISGSIFSLGVDTTVRRRFARGELFAVFLWRSETNLSRIAREDNRFNISALAISSLTFDFAGNFSIVLNHRSSLFIVALSYYPYSSIV